MVDIRRWRNVLAIALVCLAVSAPADAWNDRDDTVAATSAAAALRGKGLEAGYNLDYDAAEEAFRAAIAADPDHPAAHRQLAATFWIKALWIRGTVTVDDYFGQVSGDLKRRPPPQDMAAPFHEHVDRAIALAAQRVRQAPDDAEARFQLGAAYGLLTLYQNTIEGRVVGGLRTGRRAFAEQQRALSLDPSRKDAGLQLGIYRYGVSTLSAPLRWLATLAGVGGGRETGIRQVEEAASYPSEAQTNARFTLLSIYTRERRYDDALRIIQQLRQMYPRNRLLWLETASAELRAGRPAEARRWNEEGLAKLSADPRPKASGEEARWRAQQLAIESALKKVRQ
jgi:tetratricopeptide (TPR) repeat protein